MIVIVTAVTLHFVQNVVGIKRHLLDKENEKVTTEN